jgi:adenylate kinase
MLVTYIQSALQANVTARAVKLQASALVAVHCTDDHPRRYFMAFPYLPIE